MSAKPEPYFATEDYELIEAAVLETARGRWFLAEHARRERAAERSRLMFSVQRLERVSQDTLDSLRFQALAEDLARKLDDVLRVVTIPGDGSDLSSEQRRIEQRLVEPRPFIAR
ncbi:MAG: hypothetical protein JWN07_2610 [Hyphomicrobiales bacterium]|nr:hypothetical protein [Hyphomicrobiales bacterium]